MWKKKSCVNQTEVLWRAVSGGFLCGHLLHYVLVPQNMGHTDKEGWFQKTVWVEMDLHHSGALDQ